MYTLIATLKTVAYWPIWWYSKGVVFTFHGLRRAFLHQAAHVSVAVWVKNLFVPMYGLRDWQGRLISFFVRLLQIIFRSIFLCIYAVLLLLAFILYIVLPVAIVFACYSILLNVYA